MPSLLWQLHHSEDGSSLKLPAAAPESSATASASSASGQKNHEIHNECLGPDSPQNAAENERKIIISSRDDVPDLESAFRGFISTHPSYESTSSVDETRESEYPHLRNTSRACFDYCGFGLFTYSQRFTAGAGRSSFTLAPAAASGGLHAQAAFINNEPGTLQSELRVRVLDYLNVADGYSVIFTASKRAAFNLVAECYEFRSRSRLVTVYDHRSESVEALIGSAKQSGARISAARFKWPALQICGEELAAELKSKSRKKTHRNRSRGLFVFPTQSRITGIKYSYQWMTMAEKHHWDVLLDVSAMGPRDMGSLGLSLFRPDFIICSFYKIFGADPTGFGCLLIKNTSLHSLRASSATSRIGMVRVIPDPVLPFSGFDPDADDLPDHDHQIAFSGPVMDLRFSEAEVTDVRGAVFESDDDRDDDDLQSDLGSSGYLHSNNGEEGSYASSSQDPSSSSMYRPDDRHQVNGDIHPNDRHQRNGDIHHDIEEEDDSIFRKIGRDEGLIDSRQQQQSDILRRILPIKEDEEYDPDELHDFSSSNHIAGSAAAVASSSSMILQSSYNNNLYEENDQESWDYDDSDDEQQDQHNNQPQSLIICRGLDLANSMGLNRSNCRIKSLMDWLINSMSSLYHQLPRENNSSSGSKLSNSNSNLKQWRRRPLVRIFGPKLQIDRGPAVAFNLYDQKGALIQPSVIQKLADRISISLGCGCLTNLYLEDGSSGSAGSGSDKENAAAGGGSSTSAAAAAGGERAGARALTVRRKRLAVDYKCSSFGSSGGGSMRRMSNLPVLTATLGLVSSFEDVYRLWEFASRFLDPEFLTTELLHYQSLNQETVVLGREEVPGKFTTNAAQG